MAEIKPVIMVISNHNLDAVEDPIHITITKSMRKEFVTTSKLLTKIRSSSLKNYIKSSPIYTPKKKLFRRGK